MTPDDVQIGDVVWSKAERADGTAARGGMVADAGITEDGQPYWVVLDTQASPWWVGKQGQKSMIRQTVVTIRRMFHADIDWDTQAAGGREPSRMAGAARKCWLSAGVRSGYRGPVDEDLMRAAESLWNEVRAMHNPREQVAG